MGVHALDDARRFELGLVTAAVAALTFFAAALALAGPVALSAPAAAATTKWPSFERDLRRYERSGPRTATRT